MAATDTQEEVIMINQERNLPVANGSDGLDRMARPSDLVQTIAAIIAMTKREWMLQEQAALTPPLPKTDDRRQCAAPETAR